MTRRAAEGARRRAPVHPPPWPRTTSWGRRREELFGSEDEGGPAIDERGFFGDDDSEVPAAVPEPAEPAEPSDMADGEISGDVSEDEEPEKAPGTAGTPSTSSSEASCDEGEATATPSGRLEVRKSWSKEQHDAKHGPAAKRQAKKYTNWQHQQQQ